MIKFDKKYLAIEECYGAKKKKKNDVDVDNTVTSNLIEAKNSSKYFYSTESIRT